MNVKSVGRLFCRKLTSLNIRRSTLGTDLLNAKTVGKPSSRAPSCCCTRSSTLERSPMCAASVGKASSRGQTSFSTRRCTRKRSSTSIVSMGRAVPRPQALCTRRAFPWVRLPCIWLRGPQDRGIVEIMYRKPLCGSGSGVGNGWNPQSCDLRDLDMSEFP